MFVLGDQLDVAAWGRCVSEIEAVGKQLKFDYWAQPCQVSRHWVNTAYTSLQNIAGLQMEFHTISFEHISKGVWTLPFDGFGGLEGAASNGEFLESGVPFKEGVFVLRKGFVARVEDLLMSLHVVKGSIGLGVRGEADRRGSRGQQEQDNGAAEDALRSCHSSQLNLLYLRFNSKPI